jgi:hypothetical protein
MLFAAALAAIALLDTNALASNGSSGILADDLPGPAPIVVLAIGWLLMLRRRQVR